MNGESILQRLKMICWYLSTARSILSVFEKLFPVLGLPFPVVIVVLKNLFALAEALISFWIKYKTGQIRRNENR